MKGRLISIILLLGLIMNMGGYASASGTASGAEPTLTPNDKEKNSVATFDLVSGANGNAPMVTLNSGYKMPVAGIGTYSLHGETCVASIKSALEQGVRLIDTANVYGNEKEVGQAVREFMEESGTSATST